MPSPRRLTPGVANCILRFTSACAFEDPAVTNIDDKLATGSFDLVVLHSASLPADKIPGDNDRSLAEKALFAVPRAYHFDQVNVIER